MSINPYKIGIKPLKTSKEIEDPVLLMKLQLGAKFVQITNKMDTSEIIEKTTLDKSDISRLRVSAIERFSVERLIIILSKLGYTTKAKVISSTHKTY